MRRQSEVIVRGKVDDLPMVDRRRGFLAILENAQVSIEPLLFQRVELSGEISEGIETHIVVSR